MATRTKTETARPKAPAKPAKPDNAIRSFVAEWSVTILILLFGTTTLVQAIVIPTRPWTTPC